MARIRRPEQALQRAIFQHLDRRGAENIFAFHYPAGGWRTKTEAAILKSIGTRAGVPDVLIVHEGKFYALELKALNGKVSNIQDATMIALETAGAKVAVAYGLNAAIKQLEDWGLLVGEAQ